MSGTIFLKCVQDESLQLPKAFIYSRSTPFLHDWFRRLSVFTGTFWLSGV
uniref:Uncharacterized protein n=1 Tax=Anguilla anguilla TaxID=7936 RepID=A0A0E9QX44_ANGAN